MLYSILRSEWPDVKPRLRPVLRNAWFGTGATHRWHPKGLDPHFAVFVAYDVPYGIG